MIKKTILSAFIACICYHINAQTSLWLGSYSPNTAHGIYLLELNQQSGSLQVKDSIAVRNASFLTLSQKGILYSVEEETTGLVHSINTNVTPYIIQSSQPSNGMHPCYIALDQTEQWLAVGNYSSGNLTLYPVLEDGSIGKAAQIIQHSGKSINVQRQEGPHVHATVFSPDNKFLLVPDLGTDSVNVYAFDAARGTLEHTSLSIPFTRGGGPRHLAFHPTSKWLYVLGELNGQINVYDYSSGSFVNTQVVVALPEGYRGNVWGADIHVSHDGRHLYASQRDPLNSIMHFSIDAKGSLELQSITPTGGKTPRNFIITKDDQYLLAENQQSKNIVVFKRSPESGLLEYINQLESVTHPVCLVEH